MKILVTGGAGFIGSHLVDRLIAEENEVIAIDNFNTGKEENLSAHRNLKVVDISILDDIEDFFKEVDVVFHLAALTRPQFSILKPDLVTHANVDGTLKVLMASQKHNIKRVVFTSSSSLYGTQKVYPVKEDAIPYPESPYGLTKLVGEQYAQLYARMYGLEVNCVRPFNVYGKRQNPIGGYAAAVPSFTRLLKNDEPGKITGDGEQSRDFTFVDDLVELLILASTSKVYGESFNGGYGRTVSVNYMYQTIAKLLNKDIPPIYIPEVLEPRLTWADNTKAKELLGWQPQYPVEEGLKRTV